MSDNLTNQSTLTTLGTAIAAKTVYYYDAYALFPKLIGPQFKVALPDGNKAVTFSQLDYLTVALHTEATGGDSETFTTVARTLTPAVHQANVLTGIESWSTSAVPLVDMFSEAFAAAYARYVDGAATYSFAADYAEAPSSGPDHEIGADSTAYTAALIRQGASLLMTAGAKRPYHLVLDPIQFEELLRDPEARGYMMGGQAPGSQFAATLGVGMDRFLGQIYGVYVWVADAMIESSGLHSMMFGQGAMGMAYKPISTPLSPTPTEVNVDIEWDAHKIGYRTVFSSMFDIDGIAFTSTTNKFIVDIIS